MVEQRKTNKGWLAVGVLLFCAGMAVAAVWDLQIDKALNNPKSIIAILFECFGYYALYGPVLLGFILLAADAKRQLWLRCTAGAVGAVGAVALGFVSRGGLLSRGVTAANAICVAAWVLLLVGVVLLLRAPVQRERILFACAFATVLMLANNIVINVLKLIWNRMRFDDMAAAGSFAGFTPWTHPFGSGGTSFPSGHTAAACGIFILVLLCDVLPAWNRHRTVVWGACWAYIAAMALCRIVIGRHFLSDTLMAAFLITLLLLAMTHTRWYRAALVKLHARCAQTPV